MGVSFQLAVCTMGLVLTSFFGLITDRRIGAAYCTLLHSCNNFGTFTGRVAYIAQMRPIATDGVAWSVCLVTLVSLANTVEPIEMPLRVNLGGPKDRTSVLDYLLAVNIRPSLAYIVNK